MTQSNDDTVSTNVALDSTMSEYGAVAECTDIEVVKILPSPPNLNPTCEHFLDSVRRERLDHVVILSESQLHRVLREAVTTYFNRARPHQGLSQRIPALAASRSVPEVGKNVVGLPILGGLHHDYPWAASAPLIRAGAHADGKGSQHAG